MFLSLCSIRDTATFRLGEISGGVIWRAFRIAESLSLREKISQIAWVYPPGVSYCSEYPIGGAIFNQRHVKLPGFPRRVEEYHRANPLPIGAAADQEGGRINRMRNVPGCEGVAKPVEMATWSTDSVEMYAFAVASSMRRVGLTVNLAPVLDVATDSSALMFRMGRTFGLGFENAQNYGRAFSKGMRRGGVLLIAKHFPGYGNTRWNSDVQLTVFNGDSSFAYRNLEVFANLSNLVDGYMLSSLIYPFWDSTPAPFSRKVVSLAREIDVWKVVMTDDLWAPALREYIREDYREEFTDEDLERIFEKAFLAGNDVLMILYPAKLPVLYRTVEDLVEERGLMKRLDSSVVRVLLLKHKAFPYLIDSLYYSRFKTKRLLFVEEEAWRCVPVDEMVEKLRRFGFSGVVLLGGGRPACKRDPKHIAELLGEEGFEVFSGMYSERGDVYTGFYLPSEGVLVVRGRSLRVLPYEGRPYYVGNTVFVVDLAGDESYAYSERVLDEGGFEYILYSSFRSLKRLDMAPVKPE